jgi:hypothetical protein
MIKPIKKLCFQLITSLWILLFIVFSTDIIASEKKSVAVHKIRDHVHVISHIYKNGYINLGVFEGYDGLLLVNSSMESGKSQYQAVLNDISDKPVKYIINSNDAPYNHKENSFWADKGAVIISHENFENSSRNHQLLFTDKLSFTFGAERIIAYQSSPLSIGNINIYLEQANVVFLADEKGLIKYEEGLDKALNMGNDHTIFISANTGKNITMDSSDIRKLKTIVSQVTQRVEQLHQQDHSINEIVKDESLLELVLQLEKHSAYRKSLRSRVISIIEANYIETSPLFPEKSIGYYNSGHTYPHNIK